MWSSTLGAPVAWDGSRWTTPAAPLPVDTIAGTTYAPVLLDCSREKAFTSSSAVTVSLPANATLALPVGWHVLLTQLGAGVVTINAPGGGTVNGVASLTIRAANRSACVRKVATDTWLATGDTSDAAVGATGATGPAGAAGPAGTAGSLTDSHLERISPGGGTALSTLGCTLSTTIGTVSHPVLAATDLNTSTRRAVITSAGTAPSYIDVRPAVLNVWRGNAAGLGGFRVEFRFSLNTLQTGMRSFVGLMSTVAALSNFDPLAATTNHAVGMAINASTGNWSLVCNTAGTAPTAIALGAGFPVNNTTIYKLVLVSAANGAAIDYTVVNVNTNEQTTGSLTTNLPANTAFMAPRLWLTNNTTASAVAASLMVLQTAAGA